ncbi:ArnT family glycosyltransferase [Gordonia rubripertincta]|uniref:Glycosyltransferase family 39 protein n=1 Tax=Gordonia rubripertincta TaxID=36822 RepID=A0ABT4N3N8_GORRU|nr:glycosyltransferase family 39 protein [Gordonia rubripertincta]MCZ4553853.1 glycosyltransferase family 39 protein [Gordonia rubripertincta]
MSLLVDSPPASPAPGQQDPTPQPTARSRWELPSFAALIVATGVLYLWNLSANGWANSFYSAAIQAGSQSWKAWFFGSSDAANSITVDKPPMSLWIPGIAVRIFGLNSWSIIVPQALMGVASVALLYWIVRKRFGPAAGLISGAVLALTPVAALMFRFNNPDALLVLLMIAAVWATLKAIDDGRIRWMILTGVFVGFGFLTKQMQVFLVIPPLALTYIAFGQKTWIRRLGHLVAALGAMIVSAGWWVLAVELWPQDSRPYIGGSQENSILELTLGYNGFGRLSGNETGSVTPGGGGNAMAEQLGATGGVAGGFAGGPGGAGGGPGGGGGMWGQTGVTRMFDSAQGGQIAWLIPAAFILGIAALVLRGRASRTDSRRALLTVWGLWLVTTMAVFSFMAGIFHAYYTVALAPAIAGLVGAGAMQCWRRRDRLWVRIVLAAASVATGIMAYVLLDRSADFLPLLRYVVLIGSVIVAVALVFSNVKKASVQRGALMAGLVALALGLAGPAAYAIDTATSSSSGSIPSAGPTGAGGFGPGGGMRMDGRGMTPPGMTGRQGTPPGMTGQQGVPNQAGPQANPTQSATGGGQGGTTDGRGMGGGGLLEGSTPTDELVAVLNQNADDFTWVAAAIGSNSASGYQLATERSVMPIGGFNGSDPSPTLAQFQQYVAGGKIHYFIAGGGMMGGGSGTASEITAWVEANFTSTTVGSVTLYDLTEPV